MKARVLITQEILIENFSDKGNQGSNLVISR